mgnify:CR=1 FL=1
MKFGSACSLTVTNDCLEGIYQDMDFFRDKLVLRPSEISNSPEVVRRLGIISINTAIEGRHLRQRELHAHRRNQDDERHRRKR